jgi:hypothetical protein
LKGETGRAGRRKDQCETASDETAKPRRLHEPCEEKQQSRSELREARKKPKTGRVGFPTQPVSRFAPLKAWAIRTTVRLGVHSI